MTSAPNPSAEPFVLTPRLVAEKALPLLIEGKLLRQRDPRANNRYRGPDGSPCVVGAALPDEVARRADAPNTIGYGITSTRELGIVSCSDSDLAALLKWQMWHDEGSIETLRVALEAELAKGA